MPSGTVKWFNNAKGYGFILPDEGNEDLFAHYSVIAMEGYKTLKAGQAVTFEVSQGAKGLHAIDIMTCENEIEDGAEGASESPQASPSELANPVNEQSPEAVA